MSVKLKNKKATDWKLLEFYVPITEGMSDEDNFMIKGVAINETTTLNNVKYVAEELEKAAATFRDVPILLDHDNKVKNIVGRTTENVFFQKTNGVGSIPFEAKIMDKDIQERIKDGRIKNVSIGAKVEDLIEEEDGSMKALGLMGLEISFVAVPGDQQADFAQALTHGFKLKEMMLKDQLNQKEDKMAEETEKPMEEESVEVSIETPTEEAKEEAKEEVPVEVAEEKVQNINVNVDTTAITEMRKEVEELKSLLVERKKLKEEVEETEEPKPEEKEEMADETKGEVSEETTEEKAPASNVVVERADSGRLALYRDYSAESSETKLKRLVR